MVQNNNNNYNNYNHKGKPLSLDVTVPDTYADAHVSSTAMETGAAASLAATNKTNKYRVAQKTKPLPNNQKNRNKSY